MSDWREDNRRHLALTIEALNAHGADDPDAAATATHEAGEVAARMDQPPALDILADVYGLDAFERWIVVACAADQVDPAAAVDGITGVGAALDRLPDAHWSVLGPEGPLRASGVIVLDEAAPFVGAGLTLAPDVTAFLLGLPTAPASGAAWPVVDPPSYALASQTRAATGLAASIAHAAAVDDRVPALELHGASAEDRALLAALVGQALGAAALRRVDPRDLPAAGADLDAAIVRWNRFARLTGSLLLVTAEHAAEPAEHQVLRRLLTQVDGPVCVSVAKAVPAPVGRRLLRHAVAETTNEERTELWQALVPASLNRLGLRRGRRLDTALADLAARFRFTEPTIQTICLEAEALATLDPRGDARGFIALLREGCGRVVRSALDAVAERVPLDDDPDVVVPPTEQARLDELTAQIQLAPQLDAPGGRRQGVVALFAGPSGTGKSHAARAVARATGLDLYRVDVSAVLSKYIGETEQNLENVLTAAAAGGAILLFDEADALFGKRSEVRDSHDRYANLGTSYLLQRIERAPAPVILTTNLKDALDPAFARRIQVVVDFPFPSEDSRREIWEGVFPAGVATEALEPDRLASLAVSGGNIQNIARRATFLAAAAGRSVTMDDLRESARREARQAGREPIEAEAL